MDAVRDAGNRWIFPEQISDDGLEKWHAVRAVRVGRYLARQTGTGLGVPMAVGLEVLDLGGG